jgi:hypothetical protein
MAAFFIGDGAFYFWELVYNLKILFRNFSTSSEIASTCAELIIGVV